MWTLLQTTSPANDIFSLAQMGVLGVVLLALILGFLWTKPAVGALMDELKAAREHARALEEIRRLLASIDRRLENLEKK